MKILILDVETAPNLAYVWGLWKNNVGLDMLVQESYMMSWGAKWLGNDKIYYEDLTNNTEKSMLKKFVKMLDKADAVVAHNGDRFDIPVIQGRCLMLGINPPSPYKQIDTLKTAKSQFRFPSNKLEYLADKLGCTKKKKHANFPGFMLWQQCLLGNDKAWAEMKKYNIQDVLSLEEVYLKILPYMKNHPNHGNYNDDEDHQCPKCGGKHLVKRGYAKTNVSTFQRWRCKTCGGWSRSRTNINDKNKMKKLLLNVI